LEALIGDNFNERVEDEAELAALWLNAAAVPGEDVSNEAG
jgi:hypothetical protein